MLHQYPKAEGALDLLDVVRKKMRGWQIEEVYSFGFTNSLHLLAEKTPKVVRFARGFIHGDHQPYVICLREDVGVLHVLRSIEERVYRVAQPIREDLSYVNRRKCLAVSIGGVDYRKISSENRDQACPRVGRILTMEHYDDIIAKDPLAFSKALEYKIPHGFSV